jgi:hypothetical protein
VFLDDERHRRATFKAACARWCVMRPSMLLLVGAVLLAGCASETVPNLRSTGVPLGAPASGGYGDAHWHLHVADPYGTALPRAAVVAYWPSPKGCDRGACERTLQYVRLRADGAGNVAVDAPAGRHVTFVASDDGLSEEWLLNESSPRSATIHLFPQQATAQFNLTWNTAEAALQGPYPACQLTDFALGGEVTPAEWIRHAVAANLTVTWTNGLEGAADLEMRYLPPPSGFEWRLSGCPGAMSPDPQALTLGAHSSTLRLTKDAMEQAFYGSESIPDHFYFGPVAKGPAVGVALPYTITMDVQLQHYAFGDQVAEYPSYGTEEITRGSDGTPSTGARTGPATAPAAGLAVIIACLGLAALRRRA